ncbi:hypothetical protein C1646_755582 [Rhizophagus diaphanus]|nr:hypothetical protein C1646_755582 [Rhizophagus diaphanus] [Rhizophagus sp. MUCL 43196]
MKNDLVKSYIEEDKIDREYNVQIDLIDSLVKVDKDFVEILKNSILKAEEYDTRRSPSRILIGYNKRWELLSEIYNHKVDDISIKKECKTFIGDL